MKNVLNLGGLLIATVTLVSGGSVYAATASDAKSTARAVTPQPSTVVPQSKIQSPQQPAGLNPQPEPPSQLQKAKQAPQPKVQNPKASVGLNPQPEPPSQVQKAGQQAPQLKMQTSKPPVGLNPQPEPPSVPKP